jgi:hypothetical protein
MANYLYPSAEEMGAIAQEKMAVLTLNDPIFGIIPIENSDYAHVAWEQRDSYTGLQQARGLNGKPSRVKAKGRKKYVMEPGVYGEFELLDETELTDARRLGGTDNIDITSLVLERQDQLQSRFVDRVRAVAWGALQGAISVLGEDGGIIHADTFPVQTASAAVAWATSATAAPLKDLRTIKLLQRGKGVSFGRGAQLFMNTGSVNALLNNTNAADLFGKRTSTQSTISGLAEINRILADADLPEIVEYDRGYINDAGTFVTFIPDNRAILVGRRDDGSRVGAYKMTRNANNPNAAPGQYTKVKVEEDVPVSIAVHNGHNGGIALEFPSAVVLVTI